MSNVTGSFGGARISLFACLAALPLVGGCGASEKQADGGGAAESAENDAKPESPAKAANSAGETKTDTGSSSSAQASTATTPAKDTENAKPAADARATTEKPIADSPTDSPKVAVPQSKIDDIVHEPATVAEAAAVLDLRKLPVPADVENPGLSIASVYFVTKLDEKPAFDAIAKFFTDNNWKIYHGVQAYPGSIGAGYARDGFRVSVSVLETGQGTAAVSVNNHGNVKLSKIPVPKHAKKWYSFDDSASYLTDVGVDQTRDDVEKLLLADGWRLYGGAGDVVNFKKNATLLRARVTAPPTQPGKSSISFSSTQLSADLPAPPAFSRLQYSDRPAEIRVDAPLGPKELAKFYRETLAAAGWKATTDDTIVDRYEHMLIFRNPAEDMLTLTMREIEEEKITRYSLEFQSAEEVAKLDEQIEQLAEKKKAEQEAELNKPKATAQIALPEGAKNVKAEENQIDFEVASGEAKSAAEAIVKALEADGWKAGAQLAEPMAGQMSLTKDSLAVAIVYIDAGLIPAKVTVTGIGIALERK